MILNSGLHKRAAALHITATTNQTRRAQSFSALNIRILCEFLWIGQKEKSNSTLRVDLEQKLLKRKLAWGANDTRSSYSTLEFANSSDIIRSKTICK